MASQQQIGTGHQFQINDRYKSDQFRDQVRDCLTGMHEDSKPFPHFVLDDFLTDWSTIAELRRELQSVAWVRKCNDLFSLSQTCDLSALQSEHYPNLCIFRNFMATEARKWLISVTGVNLGEKLALTGSRYSSGDCLLPHDDKLEGRAFAFVLYLSPNWEEDDGGQLCLFESEPAKNHPTKIAKMIQPLENMFSLFRVQHNSWHSVAEVISAQKQRLSLNGWFHYPPETIVAQTGPSPALEQPLLRASPTMDITLAEVNEWLSHNYVRPSQHRQIKRIFAYKSELSLQQFLNLERYNSALNELEKAQFECIGPPHKRHVWRLVESALDENSVLRSLLRLFRSEAITLLLTQWTGLHLYNLKKNKHEEEEEEEEQSKRSPKEEASSSKETVGEEGKEPPVKRMRKEEESEGTSQEQQPGEGKKVEIVSYIHRFERGCYVMADDQLAADTKSNGFCLDVMLFFGRKQEWQAQNGGFISFFAIGESDEIMRVVPAMNTAAIVFREPEVLNFTKYVNHRVGDDSYFVLSCSFFGISTGESESESSLGSEDEVEEGEEEDFGDDEEEEGVEGSGGGDGAATQQEHD